MKTLGCREESSYNAKAQRGIRSPSFNRDENAPYISSSTLHRKMVCARQMGKLAIVILDLFLEIVPERENAGKIVHTRQKR